MKRLFVTPHKIGLSNTDTRNKCLNSTNAGLKVTQDSFAALPATDFTASCTWGQCGRNMLRATQWPQVESRSTQPDDCGSEKATSSSGQIGEATRNMEEVNNDSQTSITGITIWYSSQAFPEGSGRNYPHSAGYR